MSTDYKVRFYLASPIYEKVGGGKHPIMLDALLARITLERQGIRKTTAELDPKNIIFAELPIQRIGKCYLCSAAFTPTRNYAKADSFVKKGTAAQDVHGICGNFIATGAVSTPALIPHVAIAEEYLDFHVRVTDKSEFFSLLKDVKHYGIGPKTSIGFGQIASIHYWEESENKCYKTDDGYPTRPLPVKDFKGEICEDAAIRWSSYYAPYWSNIGKTMCYLPRPEQYARLDISDGVFEDMVAEI